MLAVPPRRRVHPVLGVFGVFKVVHEMEREVPVVDEPVDQIDAVLTEVPDQFLVGLVAVLLQDVPCHVRGSLLDPHFALEARAGRGDHPRRQRGVAADLAALLQEGDGQVLVLAGRERRREPAPAGPRDQHVGLHVEFDLAGGDDLRARVV